MTRAPLAVLGLGGIGGLLAARTGALCVGTERTVAAIAEHGLTFVEGASTSVTRPEATTRLESPVGLLVVAVKAYDLDAALDRVEPEALDGAVIVPLLNGLEHVDVLRARLGDACNTVSQAPPIVAAGSIGRVSAASPEPGLVVLAEQAGGRITAACRELAPDALSERLAPLSAAGLELVVLEDEQEVLWEKAARLAVLAAATVASGSTVGVLRDDPAWRERLRGALAEAVSTAAADGVSLAVDDQWAMIDAMPPELTTSAARDAAAGRPTELDAITGSVVRAGRRLAVPTPVLDFAVRGGPMPSAIALIGARAGSERVVGKNVRRLAGHPLLAYAIETARRAEVFDRILVSTDSEQIAQVARWYGADAPFLRPAEYATSTSPDIEWLAWTLPRLDERYDLFAIVRATNPFRGPDAIRRGLDQLLATPEADSIRAVERVKQHPGKMWVIDEVGRLMRPLLDQSHLDVAWHAGQYQALPPVYVQNSALEIAWTRVVEATGTREGRMLAPFLTEGYEGLNIDDEDDFARAEELVASGRAHLPAVEREPYPGQP